MRSAWLAAVFALVACRAHVDGPADDHDARDRAVAAALSAHLAALPGILRVSALVHTAWQDPLAASAPSHPSASIVVALGAGADPDAIARDARRIAADALDLPPTSIILAIEPAPAVPALTRIGPFEVTARTRTRLVATLVLGFALVASLALWLLALHLRDRILPRKAPGSLRNNR